MHPCLHVSLPSCWVYHARAPSQCVSNYMFLLEAPVSCVASPFVSAARLGPDQRPQSRTPAPPTAQEYHYHAGRGLWQTAVTLGMTRTRLSDLCVLASVATATGSRPLHPPDRSRVCVPSGGVPCRGILIRVGRVCLGILGRTFSSDGCSFAATFPWKQTVALGHLKSLDTENQPEVKCLTQGHRPRVRKLACLTKHTHKHTHKRAILRIFLSCSQIHKVVLI